MQRRTPALVLAAALAVGTLAGCGSSGGSDAAKEESTTTKAPAATTTTAPAGPLKILVSNDDGYAAPGIDVLAQTLKGLDDVEVTVVAPLDNKSGTGSHSTEGPLTATDVKTASGIPATAVAGFPADAVRYAIDDQGLEPDLVIAGDNLGQNLSPAVDLSGTVGAARAGVARGVPALAVSQGVGKSFDFEAAMPFVLDWVKEQRAAVADGSAKVEVTNLNVPSCSEGEIRGLLEISSPADTVTEGMLAPQDCTSTTPEADFKTDIEAFNNGFATIYVIPNEPAS